MQRIFIFNPETDYALAVGRNHYSLPLKIRKLRSSLQLVQANIAHQGDIIAVEDDFSPGCYPHPEHILLSERKRIKLLPKSAIKKVLGTDSIITPWGWNHTFRNELIRDGVNPGQLPTEEEIDRWRLLSHRRTAIAFRQSLSRNLTDIVIDPGYEFTSADAATEFADAHNEVYFKAPWSSSGRGVVTSTGFRSPEKMREWLSGCIKTQGSVCGEIGVRRKGDFASEWLMHDGKAFFRGLSLFETTDDGRYIRNISLPYEEIMNRLRALSHEWSEDIISAQKNTLEKIVARSYMGPVGIDMLISEDGKVNPCVELNLRLTMGMMALGEIFYPPE